MNQVQTSSTLRSATYAAPLLGLVLLAAAGGMHVADRPSWAIPWAGAAMVMAVVCAGLAVLGRPSAGRRAILACAGVALLIGGSSLFGMGFSA